MLAMVVNDYSGCQASRVIVDHHREHARSYRDRWNKPLRSAWPVRIAGVELADHAELIAGTDMDQQHQCRHQECLYGNG